MLIDTHCHVDPRNFPEGDDQVLARAEAVGVGAFVVVGVGATLENPRHAVSLAQRRADVVAVVGFHPHDAASVDQPARDEIARLAALPEVGAVGEIGLDYHYDHSPRETQAEVFRHFIRLARELKKPVVIHTRSAPADTLAILDEEQARDVGGVIHCFSEDRPFARAALDMGFDLSFSGIVTFKTAAAIQDVAGWAPADRILVETDAPYLAPIPLRGKRCEPAYVVHTVKRVAELRGITPDELAALTTQNALRRFPRLAPRGATGGPVVRG
jgi:TatD DNase family protein